MKDDDNICIAKLYNKLNIQLANELEFISEGKMNDREYYLYQGNTPLAIWKDTQEVFVPYNI